MNATGLLVFARCAGFVFRAPGFSHPSVPRAVRAGLALALAAVITPSVRATDANGSSLIFALVMELVIGTGIGIAASLLYDGAYAGGRMLDDYVGVKSIAPSVDLVAPSGFGRIWSISFTGGYFLLGAYRPAFESFRTSFDRIAPGAPLNAHAWMAFAIAMPATIIGVALAVAAPAIALAFVTQVALAALSRTVPRFSTFTLSFPIVFAVVLVVTAVSIPIAIARAGHPLLLFPGAR